MVLRSPKDKDIKARDHTSIEGVQDTRGMPRKAVTRFCFHPPSAPPPCQACGISILSLRPKLWATAK